MRRDQILDAARICFARKGFHRASMADVIRESGLSAGAIYRYFTGKDEISAALAARTVAPLEGLLADLAAQHPLPPLPDIMARVATAIVAGSGPDGPIRLAPHAWSASLSGPDMENFARYPMSTIRSALIGLAERMQAEGQLRADADPTAVGATLLCLIPGFVIQHLILGEIDPDTLRTGLQSLLATTTAAPSSRE